VCLCLGLVLRLVVFVLKIGVFVLYTTLRDETHKEQELRKEIQIVPCSMFILMY